MLRGLGIGGAARIELGVGDFRQSFRTLFSGGCIAAVAVSNIWVITDVCCGMETEGAMWLILLQVFQTAISGLDLRHEGSA